MKTIEVIVKEFLYKKGKGEYALQPTYTTAGCIYWANFGAKEAQRWIPVDEELPDTPDDVSDNVLLKISVYNKKSKNTYECCIEAWYDSDAEIWHTMIDISKKDLVFTAIAWRPIERK